MQDYKLLNIAFGLYKDGYCTERVCSIIGLGKAKFYRYLKNKDNLTWFEKETLEITPLIIEIFEKSKGRFGPEKIKIKLHDMGHNISQRKI